MEKKREEVSDEFKWDLSTIYKTEEDLSFDYEKIRKIPVICVAHYDY